jgi:methionyl-tRNA formyltransferase
LENASRHSDFVDLAPAAEAASAELLRVSDGNSPIALEATRNARPDIAFVIGWSQICKAPFREAVRHQVVGFHPAPLPRLRGRGVIPWTILNQEPISGSTLFWIDDGVDSGPIIAQRFFHVARDETAASLYTKHMMALTELLQESMPRVVAGTAPGNRQEERYATWAAKRTPEDGLIDWNAPAVETERLIRAVGRPYPGAMTYDGSARLTVWSARFCDGSERYSALPGQVATHTEAGFAVMCGDGRLLEVTDWSREGARKPRMHARLAPTPESAPLSTPWRERPGYVRAVG